MQQADDSSWWDAPADDKTPSAALRYNIYIKKAGDDKAFMTIPADIATGRMKVTEPCIRYSCHKPYHSTAGRERHI